MIFVMGFKDYLVVCLIIMFSVLSSATKYLYELESPEPVFSSLKWEC